VIAQSYPDIFYRNSLSNGLVLITMPDTSALKSGDTIQVDLDAGSVTNLIQNTTHAFDMNPDDKATFKQGGMVGRVRQHLNEILQAA
jgi:3-isopropylmalate dehydratase small subunit